jgi:hypothetical protein
VGVIQSPFGAIEETEPFNPLHQAPRHDERIKGKDTEALIQRSLSRRDRLGSKRSNQDKTQHTQIQEQTGAEGDCRGAPVAIVVCVPREEDPWAWKNNISDAAAAFGVSFENATAGSANMVGESGKGDVYLRRILPRAIVLKCGEMLGGLK